MSLLLCGLDPYIKIKEIPEDKLADFRSYRNFINRCLTFYGGGIFHDTNVRAAVLTRF